MFKANLTGTVGGGYDGFTITISNYFFQLTSLNLVKIYYYVGPNLSTLALGSVSEIHFKSYGNHPSSNPFTFSMRE
jgi:hypothetical protein